MTNATKKKISDGNKAAWARADVRKRTIAGIKRAWQRPEMRRRWLLTALKNRRSLVYRQRCRERALATLQRDDYQKKWRLIRKSVSYKQRLR